MNRKLSAAEWAVLHVAQDLDRKGVHPTGDQIALVLEDMDETAVRRHWTAIRRAGYVAATPCPPGTSDPEVDGFSPDETDEWFSKSRSPVSFENRRNDDKYNIALTRLVKGKGGVISALSEITGLTPNAIKSRVSRTEIEDAGEEADHVNSDMARYFARTYGKSDDPAVREFLLSINRREE